MPKNKIAAQSIERITPSQAQEYLGTSLWNRPLSATHIAAIAADMKNRRFKLNGDTIKFYKDAKGVQRLLDGHHRLHACLVAGVSFTTMVVRSLPEEARSLQNGVRADTVADKLTGLKRHKNGKKAQAYLAQATRLLLGQALQMKTLEVYDVWRLIFEEGHAFAVDALVDCLYMKNKSVAGAFAFAYKAHPEKISKLALSVRDGTCRQGEVGFMLRDYLLVNGGRKTARTVKQTNMELSLKVMNAIHGHLKGKPLSKLLATPEGHAYFKSFYSVGKAAKMRKQTVSMRSLAATLISDFVKRRKEQLAG